MSQDTESVTDVMSAHEQSDTETAATTDMVAFVDSDKVITLSDIDISHVNRSHGAELNADAIDALAGDIASNGLLHPITLRLVTINDICRYEIVAGAHRYTALHKLRGADGVLHPGEYRMLPADISDETCFGISVAENLHRTQVSAIAEARYVARLVESDMTQEQITNIMKKTRLWVCAAVKLVRRWNELPRSWQSDLSAIPGTPEHDEALITFTHWTEASPKLPAVALTDRNRERLDELRLKSWSARKLSQGVAAHIQLTHGECEGDESAKSYDTSTESHASLPSTIRTATPLPPVFDVEPHFSELRDRLESARPCCGRETALLAALEKLIEKVVKRQERLAI